MLKPIFDNIPQELKDCPNWVNWRLVPREDRAKPTKPPNQPDGRLAKIDDSSTWNTFSEVAEAAPRFDGMGFVLTKDDPYVGLDFDNCRCPAFDGLDDEFKKEIASGLNMVLPEIAEHIRRINSYAEVSPSGKGIRVFLKGTLPVDGKRKGPIEAYQSGRYVTVTGHALEGFPLTIEHRQAELDAFFQDVFGTSENSCEQKTSNQQIQSNVDWKERLEKTFQSKNGEEIRKLYYGDQSAYPSQSEADLALCSHLAFWLDGDATAIDAAFRESGLFRNKWDIKHHGNGQTYGQGTIEKALQGCKSFYGTQEFGENQSEVSSDNLPEPIPFDNDDKLPEFPVEAILDDVCREMVIEVSNVMQIDPGFPATMLLGALSTTAQRKYEIDLITHCEHSNLYSAGILDSGERKTPTVNIMLRPLYDYEILKQEEVKESIYNEKTQRTVKENRIKYLQSNAAKSKDKAKARDAMREAEELSNELMINPEPALPLYTCNDVTTEKLAVLMAENNEQMSVLSAEGGIFDILAGRYSEGQGNIDLYLQAYSHEPVSIHRIGRESIVLRNPCLTICLGIQPAVIEEIGRHKRFRGRGLLARFLYAKCKPRAGNRPRMEKRADDEIINRYNKHITDLMGIQFTETVIVSLSQEAQAVWNEFYNDIDREMAPGGKLYHLKDWGNKLPGTVARIAGQFHFSKYGSDIGDHPISTDIIGAACAIGIYFMEHAIAIFRIMNEPENIKIAKTILEYIKREKPESLKGRDVMRHTNLQTMGEVQQGLNLLCERAFICPKTKEKYRGFGRPEATFYEVNPKFLISQEATH